MSNWGFYVNTNNCVGCKACEIACKNRNNLESPGPRLRHVTSIETGKFPDTIVTHMSTACMHCEKPACMEVCPAGAITKDADGAVIAIREKCIGCHYCFFACPFGVPAYRESDGTMIKCDLCADRRAMGLEPACVHTCFYGGLYAGPLNELSTLAKENAARQMVGETNPSVLIS